MPERANIHSRASAIALKIFGADLSPNGSTASVNILSCHLVPSNGRSSGCTGTMWYAFLISSFASSVPLPIAEISAAASSTDVYDSEHKAGSIPSYTLWPCGDERSVMRRHLPC